MGQSPRRFRVAFMGTPEFAVPTLEALIAGPDDVVAVFTNPDRGAGRGRAPTPPPVKVCAELAGIPVYQPRRARDPEVQQQLVELELDLCVVVAYGHILPQSILDIPRLGCINVHASLLPELRGAAPINWAIVRGHQTTGITVMQMDRGMDTGAALLSRSLPIAAGETAGELHDRLMPLGAEALTSALELLAKGELHPVPQDHERATYAPMMKKTDGAIDWTRSAADVVNHVHGFNPWPGAYTDVLDSPSQVWQKKRLKIHRAGVAEADTSARPGTVVGADSEGVYVASGRGLVRIDECQMPGKRAMASSELLRGSPMAEGTRFGIGQGDH